MKRKQVKRKSTREKQAQIEKRKKNILIAVACVFLISVGYIGADTYMIRHAKPAEAEYTQATNEKGEETKSEKNLVSLGVSSLALDDSVMLSSVIAEAGKQGFSSVTFDLKRKDGSIGYASSLTTVDTFGAVVMPATKLHESIKKFNEKNITPIARICCYKDSIAPQKSSDMALMKDNKLYKDDDGNTYLNPDSDTAYKYIKDIVLECYNLGVRNFVLSSTALPENVRKGHGDGFDKLVSKLKADVGADVVFLDEVQVKLNGWNEEDGEYNEKGFKNQINKLPKLGENQIYYINTEKELKDVKKALNKNGVKRYIIFEE